MNSISIIGAGPGAIDLLTIRAEKKLKEAEVLIWTDSLISPEIINLASNSCERIPTSSLTLEEIIKLIVSRINQGKRVVRLHDGDPCLYGAISEQICRLADEGIDVEIIPGISAYQAAAARLNCELTAPQTTQTIILSRSKGRTEMPENEDLEKLAAINASLCIYLSARHVKEVEKKLLEHYPEDTPVAICYRVSWKDEWVKVVNLNKLAKETKDQNLIRTTLFIVSPALRREKSRSKLYSPDHSHLFRQEK